MKRKWLKVLIVAMMAGASFGSPMNPKEIEELMYIMNQTRIEWTVPDEDDTGKRDGLLNPPISGGWREDDSIGCVEKLGVTWSFSGYRTTGFCEAARSPQ